MLPFSIVISFLLTVQQVPYLSSFTVSTYYHQATSCLSSLTLILVFFFFFLNYPPTRCLPEMAERNQNELTTLKREREGKRGKDPLCEHLQEVTLILNFGLNFCAN